MEKGLLILALITTLFVGIWIASNVYHNISTSTIPQNTQIQIIPITPVFDKDAINDVTYRKVVAADLGSTPSATVITPAPRTSTNSGSLNIGASTTPSANLTGGTNL